MNPLDLLSSVPEASGFAAWREQGARVLVPGGPVLSLLAGCLTEETRPSGLLATYLADLLGYPDPADQVDLERLHEAMVGCPNGCRTWWTAVEGTWWPFGYTLWHPVSEEVFHLLEAHPERISNRRIPPAPGSERPLVYLFNFSVAPPFRKTENARLLMKTLAMDLEAAHPGGLACLAVSDDGVRVAERFGLHPTGPTSDGHERAFAKRWP